MSLNNENFHADNVEGATAFKLDTSQELGADALRGTTQEKSIPHGDLDNMEHEADFDFDLLDDAEHNSRPNSTSLEDFVQIDFSNDGIFDAGTTFLEKPEKTNTTLKESLEGENDIPQKPPLINSEPKEKPTILEREQRINVVPATRQTEEEPVMDERIESENSSQEFEMSAEQFEDDDKALEQLASLRKQLKKASLELIIARNNEVKAKSEISKCEEALDRFGERYDVLYSKSEQEKNEIKKTKRSALKSFGDGLRIVKNLAFGKHGEVRDILDSIGDDIDANEDVMNRHKETSAKLESYDRENVRLEDDYEDAISKREMYRVDVVRLENRQARIQRQIEMLREDIAEGETSRKRKDIQDAIKRAIKESTGQESVGAFKRMLDREERKSSKKLKKDMKELNKKYLNPTEIDILVKGEEQVKKDQERAEEAERILQNRYDKKMDAIDSSRDRIDQYFPTPIDEIIKNKAISKSLSTLKRKVLMKIYGIA